ncbi:MAG TPA: methyltransferase domain-containing protein [Steroidobacteraceae bacterium]|jgi:SAM-dependent methyltransferase|nr:methyltransferase domain-containing protein [Steroidobacteraceae bacterium]
MLADPCPCGSAGADILLSHIDRYGLPLDTVLCSVCGTLRIDPYLDDASLADFYTHHYQQMYARSTDQLAYFAKQQAYGERILDSVKHCLPPGSFVFEIGCGAGGALDVLRTAGYRVSGCDYSRELIDFGCSRGLPLHWGAPVETLQHLPSPSLVYMHHVFEHVREPLSLLLDLRKLLASDGKVLIIVPDVSRISGFPFPAGDLRLFVHIAHRFNFSLQGLRLLAARANLMVDRLQQCVAYTSPEIWALLSGKSCAASLTKDPHAGAHMLAYLRRTERLRALQLTRGQIVSLPARVRGRLSRIWGRMRNSPKASLPNTPLV